VPNCAPKAERHSKGNPQGNNLVQELTCRPHMHIAAQRQRCRDPGSASNSPAHGMQRTLQDSMAFCCTGCGLWPCLWPLKAGEVGVL